MKTNYKVTFKETNSKIMKYITMKADSIKQLRNYLNKFYPYLRIINIKA